MRNTSKIINKLNTYEVQRYNFGEIRTLFIKIDYGLTQQQGCLSIKRFSLSRSNVISCLKNLMTFSIENNSLELIAAFMVYSVYLNFFILYNIWSPISDYYILFVYTKTLQTQKPPIQ